MPLLKIQSYPGFRQVFIAGDYIADLATVELLPGERQVKMGATGDEHLAAGVARGAAVSGALVRVVTEGIVSGVKTFFAVQAGDRLTIAKSGAVTPFNTITTSGLISGLTVSGWLTSGNWTASGLVLSGFATITPFYTGRVLGKALTSGLSGLGIQMMVSLG